MRDVYRDYCELVTSPADMLTWERCTFHSMRYKSKIDLSVAPPKADWISINGGELTENIFNGVDLTRLKRLDVYYSDKSYTNGINAGYLDIHSEMPKLESLTMTTLGKMPYIPHVLSAMTSLSIKAIGKIDLSKHTMPNIEYLTVAFGRDLLLPENIDSISALYIEDYHGNVTLDNLPEGIDELSVEITDGSFILSSKICPSFLSIVTDTISAHSLSMITMSEGDFYLRTRLDEDIELDIAPDVNIDIRATGKGNIIWKQSVLNIETLSTDSGETIIRTKK